MNVLLAVHLRDINTGRENEAEDEMGKDMGNMERDVDVDDGDVDMDVGADVETEDVRKRERIMRKKKKKERKSKTRGFTTKEDRKENNEKRGKEREWKHKSQQMLEGRISAYSLGMFICIKI